MTDSPEAKICDPTQFARLLHLAYPAHTDVCAEVLSEEEVWGYLVASDGLLKCFRGCYGRSGRWTISPLYLP